MPTFVPSQTTTDTGGGTFVPSVAPGSVKGKKKKKKGTPWYKVPSKTVEHFGGDIITATVGMPAAVKKQATAIGLDIRDVTNPGAIRPGHGDTQPFNRTVDVAKEMAKSYVDYYGPLAHGDVGKFINNVYEHPLQLTLDATTIASLGFTAPVKIGLIPARGGRIMEITDAAGNVTRTKPLAKSELRARLQSAKIKTKNAQIIVPKSVPKYGGKVIQQGGKEAARISSQQARRQAANNLAPLTRFNRSIDRLNPNERVAAALRGQYDRPALNAEIDRLQEIVNSGADEHGTAAAQLQVITNRKVQNLFDKPNKKMTTTLTLAREVGETMRSHLNVNEVTAEARRHLPARIAHGAKLVPDKSVKPKVGERVQLPDGTTGKVSRVYDDGSGVEVRTAKGGGDTRSASFDEATSLDAPQVWEGGPTIAELKARGHDPIYFPDVSNLPERPIVHEGQGGGLGVPQKVGATRQNQGVLRTIGEVVNDPATLSRGFAQAVKYGHYVDIHDRLIGMAREHTHIPPGYVAVRARASEHIPYTTKTRGEFGEWTEKHLGDDSQINKDVDLTTPSESDAIRTERGNVLIVPKSVAHQMTGEFRSASRFTTLMNRGPMRVWRAMVLGLTPRYLVNNVVGNTMMYIMRSGSPKEIRALAGAMREIVRKKDPTKLSEFDRLLEKHFAGQAHGGFQASQYPSLRPTGRIGRTGAAITGFIPKMDRTWEQALRKAKVKAELRRHPELKAAIEKMGRDHADINAIDANPALAVEQELHRLHTPDRDAFASEVEGTFPGQQANDIMELTDILAAYGARNKGIPLEQAYDNFTSGITHADIGDEAPLYQAPVKPARINEPPTSPEHGQTLRDLDTAWERHNKAENDWVEAGKPESGPIYKEKLDAKNSYEAHRLDEMHQRLWDSHEVSSGGPHHAERQGVLDALRAKLGKRSGVQFPKRFATDKGAHEMFNFLDELSTRGKWARHWYRDSGKAILRMVNGDKAEGAKLTQLVAIYSPQQAVVGNLGLAMRAYEAYKRGDRIPVGQDWQREAADRVMSGTGGWEGRKTNNFYGNLLQHVNKDKFKAEGYTGKEVTADMWMSRVFGYLRDEVADGRYDVIQGIVQQIAKERGWKPQEVQAAIWTAIKDADIEDISANVDFATAAERNIHTINVPGAGDVGTIAAAADKHRLQFRQRDLGVGGTETIRTAPAATKGVPHENTTFEVSGAPADVQNFVNELTTNLGRDVHAIREGTTGGGKPTIVIKHKDLSDPKTAQAYFESLNQKMGKRAEGYTLVRDGDGIQIVTTGSYTRATLPDLEAEFKAAINETNRELGLRGVKSRGTQSSVLKGKKVEGERVRDDVGGVEGAVGERGAVEAGDTAGVLHQSGRDYTPQYDAPTADRIAAWRERFPDSQDRDELAATLVDEDEAKYPGSWEAVGFDRGAAISEYLHEIEQAWGPAPLGQGVGQGARGAFNPATRLIHLFDQADPSTVPHEFVHAIDKGGGFSQEHIATLERHTGAKYGTREFSEGTATSFEQYLREGKAPTAALTEIFSRWKDLLTRLYRKADELGTPISDEVRQVWDEVLKPPAKPREKTGFEQADAFLNEHPEVRDAVYDKVNDALGNYEDMTTFEKGTIRNLFPFYAWFRAISGITLKYTLDHPLAINLLSRLSNIAIEEELRKAGIDPEDVPASLKGMIVLGIDPDGRIRGLNTAVANPFATVGQLADFVSSVAGAEYGEIGAKAPGLNPFLAFAQEAYGGKTPLGYQSEGFSPVESLPQWRILRAIEAQYGVDIPLVKPAATGDPLYDHDIVDELLRVLGVPYIRASKTAAKKIAHAND